MPKKILVAICIFLIICIAHLKGYCIDHVIVDNNSNVDAFNFLVTKYNQNWYRLVNGSIIYARNHNNTFSSSFTALTDRIINGGSNYVWFITDEQVGDYFKNNNGTSISSTDAWIFYGYATFDTENDRTENYLTVGSSYSSTSNSSRNILVFDYKTNASIYRYYNYNQNYVSLVTDGRLTIPYGLERYVPTDLYSILSDIANHNFDFDNTNVILNDIDNKITQTQMELENLNDFIQDDTTSQYTQNDLPSDSLNDITASSFNSIFTSVYNKMTTEDSQTVTIPIPYLNYNITISSNTIKNALINNGFSAIVNIISVVWFGVISLYILKDIYRYINQIKNGDIGHTDTNIKTEVL